MNEEFRLMPEQASSISPEIDRLYVFLCGLSGVMLMVIGSAILFLAIRYRQGSRVDRRPTKTHFFAIEASWIVGPFIIVMLIFFWGAHLYLSHSTPPDDAMEITGVARQWMWKFQHPDGRAEINDLHVPLGQNVKVRLISEDVIHSLYIPAFRVKQDVLPGRYTTLWFKPTKVGRYHLFCAEYCGAKHSQMQGVVHVLEPAKYQAFLAGALSDQSPTNVSLLEQFRCHTCHQGGGEASRGPPLQDLIGKKVPLTSGQTVVADEAYIRESIVRPQAKIVAGYPALMPSFDGQISEEGLNQIIAEIKSLGGGDRKARGNADDAIKRGPEQKPDAPMQGALP